MANIININTNVFIMQLRDSVRFDNDVMVGQLRQTEFGKGRTNINEIYGLDVVKV